MGVAVLLTGSALVASIPRSASVEAFNDQGQPFFPDFKDPGLCSTLEVVEVDAATAMPRPFKVANRDGRWVIPSHNNYPADAADRLEKTAARVIGLTKDTIRSSRTEDHKSLGVVDPMEATTGNLDGVGKRITLRDKSDRVLADYILGKDVPGRPGQKFVRRPGQARTYGVNMQAEPSTRFADWIEPNLLKIQANQIVGATFVNDKVDLAQGAIVKGGSLTITRKDGAAPWNLPGLPTGQEVDPAKTSAMVSALTDLKIAGVRPKPQGLAEMLKEGGGGKLDTASQMSMQARGFYILRGQLYSDEGALIVNCDDGVRYALQFGKVTFAEGEALSAGSSDEEAKAKEGEKAKAGRLRREPLPLRPGPVRPQGHPQAPGGRGGRRRGSCPPTYSSATPPRSRPRTTAGRARLKAYEAKVEAGKKRAAELSERFAPWYYVVPGDAYRSLVLDRQALVHDKPAPGSAPPQGGNPFGGGGLPPGLQGLMPKGHP